MTKIKPDISVIMSVNNNFDNYLQLSIESILNQSFKNFEFIIINDGNKKYLENIINEYSKKDKRIVYKTTPGIGLTASLNYAISFSKAKFIARQDYDDISTFNRLDIQYNFLKNNNQYIFCASNVSIIDNMGNIKSSKLYQNIFKVDNKKIVKQLKYKNIFSHSSCMFVTKSFRKSGGYDENFKFTQDYDLWSRMIKHGKFIKLKEKLINLRIHKNSISSKKNKEQRFYSFFIGLKYTFPQLQYLTAKISDKEFLNFLESKYVDNYQINNNIIARKYVYLYDQVNTLKFLSYSLVVKFQIIKLYYNRPSYLIYRLF